MQWCLLLFVPTSLIIAVCTPIDAHLLFYFLKLIFNVFYFADEQLLQLRIIKVACDFVHFFLHTVYFSPHLLLLAVNVDLLGTDPVVTGYIHS